MLHSPSTEIRIPLATPLRTPSAKKRSWPLDPKHIHLSPPDQFVVPWNFSQTQSPQLTANSYPQIILQRSTRCLRPTCHQHGHQPPCMSRLSTCNAYTCPSCTAQIQFGAECNQEIYFTAEWTNLEHRVTFYQMDNIISSFHSETLRLLIYPNHIFRHLNVDVQLFLFFVLGLRFRYIAMPSRCIPSSGGHQDQLIRP